jgi:hypothetical protein
MNQGKSILVIGQELSALYEYAAAMVKDFNRADVFWLKPIDDAKTIGVKETVPFMELAHLAPVGDGKLMIICDMATMTVQAQNKTLKTLEDAPAQTTFLLLSTSVDAIISTVKSRCRTMYLPQKPGDCFAPLAMTRETLSQIFNMQINEKDLSTAQKAAILDTLAEVNKRVTYYCNEKNQQDLIIMEILKQCKQ